MSALRYRWVQALVVLVLASLVTAACAFAPLYVRALDQAVVATTVRATPAADAGVRILSFSTANMHVTTDYQHQRDLVPEALKPALADGIPSISVGVRRLPLAAEPEGSLLWRAGLCEHVRMTSGTCPNSAGEIAISADQARVYDQAVGSTLEVGEWDASVSRVEVSPQATLTVTGIYEQVPGDYWFGATLTGAAAGKLGFDTMLTPEATLVNAVRAPAGGGEVYWAEPHQGLDLPLRPDQVTADNIARLGAVAKDWIAYPLGVSRYGSDASDAVTVSTSLPAIADAAAASRGQARVTVPLLMAQLGLLLCTVLWLVLVGAADQRRGEAALARLRGRGSGGVRSLLLRETLPPIVAGVPVGLAAAVGLAAGARHTLLAPAPPAEFPPTTAYAALLALLVMLALAASSVRRVARAPIADLLRSVPAGRAKMVLGLLEAMVVAAAIAAFVALVTGAVRGPVGQLAPTLLAVAVGIVAARVVPVLLAWLGGMALHRGWARAATALLHASRRSATRWLTPIVTVAVAIVVLSADLFAVGALNRQHRAAAETGAPTVLDLGSRDLKAVSDAIRAIDPTGTSITPVVTIDPIGSGNTTTIGVLPDAFSRIALWPGADPKSLAWQALRLPEQPPLEITGTSVSYAAKLPTVDFTSLDPDAQSTALSPALQIVDAAGATTTVPLGAIPTDGFQGRRSATIPCAQGCRVIGLGVSAPLGAAGMRGTLILSDLRIDDHPLDLGTASTWRPSISPEIAASDGGPGALTLTFANSGQTEAFVVHESVPQVLPALTTAPATPAAAGATIGGYLVDGSDQLLTSAGPIAYVPGGPARAALVNLDSLLIRGWSGRGSAKLTAYLSSSDPSAVASVRERLTGLGIPVTGVRHPADLERTFARSGAAWSLQLTTVVGGLALLTCAVALIVLIATSWRSRSRDYAGLRMAGLTRRDVGLIAMLETVPVVLLAGGLGLAAGLWSAPAALPMVPLFTTPSAILPPDLRTAYGPSLLVAAAALVILAVVAALASRYVARRSRLDRLREAA